MIEFDAPPVVNYEIDARRAIERRPQRLASGLQELRVPAGAVAVHCCDRHGVDAEVARRAARLLGREAVVVPIDVPHDQLGTLLAEAGATLLLACAEGTDHWQRSHFPIVVVGDGPNVYWWRSTELRASEPQALDSSSTVPAPCRTAVERNGVWGFVTEALAS